MRRLRQQLLITACLIGCASPPDPEITIGVIAPLARNPATFDGAKLAAAEINAGGGLPVGDRKRKIRLLLEDSEHRPETAVSKALRLINREGAVALVGVPMSANAIPVSEIAERHRIPLVSTMSSHPQTTAGKSYAFRLATLDSVQGRVMAQFAYHELAARRAAAFVDAASTYGVHLAEAFTQAFRDTGGQIVSFETYTEEDTDVAPPLRRIKDTRPDVLFLPGYSQAVCAHMKQARELGIEAVFLGGDTWNLIVSGEVPATVGAYFSDVWAPDYPSDKAAAFIASYRRAFGATPTTSAALAYDSIAIVAEAIRRKGQADPEAIAGGLAAIDHFEGVSGNISFHGSGDPVRSVLIRRIGGNGTPVFFKELKPDHFDLAR